MRQRSRPYLFSNTLAPAIVGGSLKALEILSQSTELRDKLEANTRHFRKGIESLGYTVLPGEHSIVPIMIGDAGEAVALASRLLELGVYVIAFSFPVVPRGAARIRTQISAAHSIADLDFALEQFDKARRPVT
ncbi:MAG: aminotransferase class I/II-fold pyridoxal phosphate-dependent enzyme [Planctomycetaceae bacterium]